MSVSFKSALLNPINLVMLLLAIFAGLLSAWWLFPVGLFLWLVMVIIVARDPGTKIREGFHARPAVAQRFKKTTDRISRSQVKVYNTIQQMSKQHQRTFQPLLEAVNSVADNAFNLAERMTIIENHRVTSESKAELNERINAAKMELLLKEDDSALRKEQESIIQSLEKRMDQVIELDRSLDRVEAQLNSMLTEIENALTEIVRMQGFKPDESKSEIKNIIAELDRESREAIEFKMAVGAG